MGWIIFAIVLTVICFKGIGFVADEIGVSELRKCRPLALLCLLFVIPAFIAIIPANSVGIVYNAFTGTSQNTLDEGWHGKTPFDRVYTISTEIQTIEVTGLTTQTRDAQYVDSSLDIKVKVNSNNAYLIFKQFKTLDNMSKMLIAPTSQRVLEQITTNYNVMDILGEKRNEIYKTLEADMATELAKYGVDFDSISIVDMNAGEEIESAITAEAVAKKAVETAEQELLKTETEAKKQIKTAQAEKEAAEIKAQTKIIEAEAEKKANELLQQSLTDSVLKQKWIDKWNGHAPTYYAGSGENDLIFSLPFNNNLNMENNN